MPGSNKPRLRTTGATAQSELIRVASGPECQATFIASGFQTAHSYYFYLTTYASRQRRLCLYQCAEETQWFYHAKDLKMLLTEGRKKEKISHLIHIILLYSAYHASIKLYSMKVAGVQCDCKSSQLPTHVSEGGHCFSTLLQVQLYLAEFHQQNANIGVERGVIESANRHDILLQACKSATIYSTIILYYNSP